MVQEIRTIDLNYIQRFNPDGFCRSVSIDFITFFLRKHLYSSEAVLNATDSPKTLKFFLDGGFNVKIMFPILSYFSVRALCLRIKREHWINDANYKKITDELCKQRMPFCILYHLTAKQLYDLDENWSHTLVIASDSQNTIKLFDPLGSVLHAEFSSTRNWLKLDKKRLDTQLGVKLLIW